MARVDLLLATGMLWGCTNPFLKIGSKGLRKVRAETRLGQVFAEIRFLLERFEYVLPCVINLLGSLVYVEAAKTLPLSLAVPIANSLAFAFTALTGALFDLEEPLNTGSVIGVLLITVGTAICCWDTNE